LLLKDEEMIANHIHDALSQVKKLQEFILEKRLFGGYSGKARIVCGFVALMGAVVLGFDRIPQTVEAHEAGWAVVLLIGILANYGCLIYWFMFDHEVRRNPVMLKPAMDALPALGAGAVFTLVFILEQQHDMLFGMWMCFYGLAQVAYRQSLPLGIYYVGVGYMLAGTCLLLCGTTSFLNPWPMGIVFFCGELAGGLVLLKYKCVERKT
jgi:hypothetical protein